MVFFQDSDYLTDNVIDKWSKRTQEEYIKVAGKRATDLKKLQLSLEEVLLRFREAYGTKTPCTIRGIRAFDRIYFEISQTGTQFNPLDIAPDMGTSYDLLALMGVYPRYVFRERQNRNVVIVRANLLPRKNVMLTGILCAAVLALFTRLLSGWLPAPVRDGYLLPFVSGVFSKMTSVFSELAIPLVFCAVIIGIVGMENLSSFGKLGGKLVKRMMLTYGIAMAAMLVIGIPMGLVTGMKSAGGRNVFSDLLTLVLDIIPGNLIEPFRIDNDMQVIVLAMFIGVVMLGLGDRVAKLRQILNEFSLLINGMMVAVCKLLPLLVYFGLANLLIGGRISHLADVSKIIVISLAGAAITISITVIRTLKVTKLPFKRLYEAQLPSLLINLTTSSQVSALPESMKCCKEKWGIDEKLTDFSLPFGIVFYMPNGAIMLGSIVWVLADMSSGAVDPITLAKLVFVAVVVAIAAPPIPGSAFAVLPILFSACGTDLSMMPLAVIVGSTVGYLLPAMNGYCLQLELLMSAWKSDCVNMPEQGHT